MSDITPDQTQNIAQALYQIAHEIRRSNYSDLIRADVDGWARRIAEQAAAVQQLTPITVRYGLPEKAER